MFVDKSTDQDEPYFDFYVFMFLRQHQRQRKCFLSERERKKALRDTLTRAAWLGPVIFYWFVLSMRMQVILDSSFARPGSAPIWGGKKGEFRDWTRAKKDGCFRRLRRLKRNSRFALFSGLG